MHKFYRVSLLIVRNNFTHRYIYIYIATVILNIFNKCLEAKHRFEGQYIQLLKLVCLLFF